MNTFITLWGNISTWVKTRIKKKIFFLHKSAKAHWSSPTSLSPGWALAELSHVFTAGADASAQSVAVWENGQAAAWLFPPSCSAAWWAPREAAAWGSGVPGASPRTGSGSSPSPVPGAVRWTPPGISSGQAWGQAATRLPLLLFQKCLLFPHLDLLRA